MARDTEARLRRMTRIADIVNAWIHDGTMGEPGTLKREPDFNMLRSHLEGLRRVSNSSVRWSTAIMKWDETIDRAIKTFCDNNGYSYLKAPTYQECPESKRAAYERLFMWAVLTGSGYAYRGA